MKIILFLSFGFLLITSCNNSVDSNLQNGDQYTWIDFDATVDSMPYGSEDNLVKSYMIRRQDFKRGTVSVVYDSTLNEDIISCTPLLGDPECPSYYKYYLVDSLWLNAPASDKFKHRLQLRKVVLPDTIIQDATVFTDSSISDSSITRLDSILDRNLQASITIEKKKVLSHDGINYYDVIRVDVNALEVK